MTETESRRVFQRRFNELLHNRNLTQKEIAAVCGVSTSTVSTWSKGINMPRMDKLERLAAYFGLPASSLIETREPEPGIDDFTYAMQNEIQELSEADRQLLLTLARQLNHARKKRDGESE